MPGRAAICLVASTIQRGARVSGTARRSNCTASHDAAAKTATAAAKPPTAIRPSLRSLATASSSATKPSVPATSTAIEAGFSAPRSRRITRSGGTRASCSTGGRPKAISSVKPTPTPNSAGQALAAGSAAPTSPASSQTKTWCTAKPISTPARLASRPTAANSAKYCKRDRALRLAEHAQHRAIVEVAVRELARRDAHRHRGQQGRQQGDEVEELLGAVQRLAHLGPAGLERLDAQAAQALRA